jgi:hypothetical protein
MTMTLREKLAIEICGAPEYTLPPWRGFTSPEDPPLHSEADAPLPAAHPTRCVCARDLRTPGMMNVRCATNLARADAAIALLQRLGKLHDDVGRRGKLF